jgi:dihydropteroate synthase
MGILNLTPDSFSDGGRYNSMNQALIQAEKMLSEGAKILDIGGYSSRPGAKDISPEEELNRIESISIAILERFPEAIISIDTFRSAVAKRMLEVGVHMINDISAGDLDPKMMQTVADFQVPYIMMHMKGNPQTMQSNALYEDVVEEVWAYLIAKIDKARSLRIKDLVIDPGFGFGKKWTHNYQLLKRMAHFQQLNLPILAGVSRKSMLYKLLGTTPDQVLPYTTALHLKALEQGANILRVHDVEEAVNICKIYTFMRKA